MYGLVEPKTGESFFREISHLDNECFQVFLHDFSQTYPQELHIIQLDNGSFHTTPKLEVPENIILLFQPAHCPERGSDRKSLVTPEKLFELATV